MGGLVEAREGRPAEGGQPQPWAGSCIDHPASWLTWESLSEERSAGRYLRDCERAPGGQAASVSPCTAAFKLCGAEGVLALPLEQVVPSWVMRNVKTLHARKWFEGIRYDSRRARYRQEAPRARFCPTVAALPCGVAQVWGTCLGCDPARLPQPLTPSHLSFVGFGPDLKAKPGTPNLLAGLFNVPPMPTPAPSGAWALPSRVTLQGRGGAGGARGEQLRGRAKPAAAPHACPASSNTHAPAAQK